MPNSNSNLNHNINSNPSLVSQAGHGAAHRDLPVFMGIGGQDEVYEGETQEGT